MPLGFKYFKTESRHSGDSSKINKQIKIHLPLSPNDPSNSDITKSANSLFFHLLISE